MGGRAGGGVHGHGLRDAERLPQGPSHESGESLRGREEVEGSHHRVPDGAALRPAEHRAGEGARAGVLRQRAARRGLSAAAALPPRAPGRPRGAPEARGDLPDGPGARQGARAGRGDPQGEAAGPRRHAAARRVRRHAGGGEGLDRSHRAEPRRARRPRPRVAGARHAVRQEPGRAARGAGVQGRGEPRSPTRPRRTWRSPGCTSPRRSSPRRRRSSRRRRPSPPPDRTRACSSPTSTCSRGASTKR